MNGGGHRRSDSVSVEFEMGIYMTKEDKLKLWQGRASKNASAWEIERSKMDEREKLYRGKAGLEPYTEETKKEIGSKAAYHVRNIVAENVESMVDSNIPQPKVTPRRKADEQRAALIENMIRNELDRMPMEEINDLLERMTPIQGASLLLVEWDENIRSRATAGEVVITPVHPKMLIPQDGVTTSIDDMDYVIIRIPQTKSYIKARYNVELDNESEEADIRTLDEDASSAEDMVTQYQAYYRGEDGAIGLFSWVDDTILEDLEDYQARRRRRCTVCGELEPPDGQTQIPQQPDEAEQATAMQMMEFGAQFDLENARPQLDAWEPDRRAEKKRCPNCGNDKWEKAPTEVEEIFVPIRTVHGTQIPGAKPGISKDGKPRLIPTRIPAYKPDCYPLIMQRNVSIFGQLLGDSDVDKIADQQNSLNWLQGKIDERLLDAGTIITLPPDIRAYRDPDDHKVYRVESPADAAMIGTYEFTGNLQYYFSQLTLDYEAARQILGITDSFQGRRDTTATSGTAKQFAAAQSAGRLESKRRMKQAAYARLFEMIFKFRLAYADEPRPVVYQDGEGKAAYDEFDRYDFLEYDEKTGQYYWNDQFLFSCDTSAPLASNREALWQEARMNLQTGAYGNPQDPNTLVMFWKTMEQLHYPLAADALRHFQNLIETQSPQKMMMEAAAAQARAATASSQPAAQGQGAQLAPAQPRPVPLNANGA